MFFDNDDVTEINENIKNKAPMDIDTIVNLEIGEHVNSLEYKKIIKSEQYYKNNTDININGRMVLGEHGLERAENVADNRLAHDYFSLIVDQKIQYLLSKEWTVESDNDNILEQLNKIFNQDFKNKFQRVAKDAVVKYYGWLFVYPQGNDLKFQRLEAKNVIPFWSDIDKTELNAVIYFYSKVEYEGTQKKEKRYAQYWDNTGVIFYEANDSARYERTNKSGMVSFEGKPYNWEKIPFIPIKYNDEDIFLLDKIKSLIDDYDRQTSRNSNGLEDDLNKTLVVKNYDGTNAGQLRRDVKTHKIIKVSDDGGVDVLDLTVDVDNSNSHLDRLKKDIFMFGRAVDVNSEFGANASAEARQYLYASLDMDCNTLERNCKNALHSLLWFISKYYNLGDIQDTVDFVFNRDVITNEASAIDMCVKSQGVQGLSTHTILSNHPFVKNVDDELNTWKQEQKENAQMQDDLYDNHSFGNNDDNSNGGIDE